MLPGPHHHLLCRRDIYEWRFSGVRMGDPERYRESVRRAAKEYWKRPREVDEEGGCAIWKCWISGHVSTFPAPVHDSLSGLTTYCERLSGVTETGTGKVPGL